jgi:divalent metal cation (Fe/Co/Zn/Cd) transporter
MDGRLATRDRVNPHRGTWPDCACEAKRRTLTDPLSYRRRRWANNLLGSGTREDVVRRGINLSYATILYNSLEAIGSLAAGVIAGSVTLVGFGADSVIEVGSSLAAQWRLRSDCHEQRREAVERRTRKIIGWTFVALGVYITADSIHALWRREQPAKSVFGLVVLVLSVIVMPLLARAKRRVAQAMNSRALEADAMQTSLCAYLSVIALAGVALNALLGWWWADPVAALAMTPIILREGVDGIRTEVQAGDICC